MKMLFKWFIRPLFYVVLLAVVVSLAGTFYLNFYLKESDYKSIIEGWVEGRTGRKLEIMGALGIQAGTGLILYAEDIRLENVSWSDHRDLFRASRLESRLSLSKLLQGRLVVEHVLFQGVDLLVEQDSDGRFNLNRRTAAGTQDGFPLVLPGWLDIRFVALEDVRILADLRWRQWDIQIDEGKLSANRPDVPVQVDARGSLNTVPAGITGTLGTLATWLQRQESEADLLLTVHDVDHFRATGTVGDVLGWRDIQANVEGEIGHLRNITPWFRYRPLNLDHVKLTGRLVQPGTFSTMSFEDFSGSADYYGIPFKAHGRVGRLSRLSGLEVKVNADTDWELEGLPLGVFTALRPTVKIEAFFTGATYELDMDVDLLATTASGMTIQGTGQVGNASRFWEQGLPIQFTLDSIHGLGNALGRNWPKAGGIRGHGILIKDKTGFVLQSIDLETTGEWLSLRGMGSIQGIGRQPQGIVSIRGTTGREFFHQNDYFVFFQPGFAEVDARWHLEEDRHRLEIEDLLLEIPGGKFQGRGQIPDLNAPGELTLKLDGALLDPIAFGALHDVELPALPPVAARILVHGKGLGHWTINATDFPESPGPWPLSMTGAVELSPKYRAIDLHFAGPVTADTLKPWLGGDTAGDILLEHLGPIQVAFDLRSTSRDPLVMENLSLQSDWAGVGLKVSGKVLALNPLGGNLDISASGQLTERLDLLPDWSPILEEVDLSFRIPLPWDDQRVEGLQLKARSDTVMLSLVGDIDRLEPLRFDRLHLLTELTDVTKIAFLKRIIMPGNVFSTDAWLKVDSGTLAVEGAGWFGSSRYEGAIRWKGAEEDARAVLNADLEIEELDLKSLFLNNKKPKQKFTQRPLLPTWMYNMDGHLNLEVDDFWGRSVHLKGLAIQSDLNAGSVGTDFHASLGQGVIKGAIHSSTEGDMGIRLVVERLPAESLRTLADSDVLIGGYIDAAVMIQGEAHTIADLLDRGKGQVRLDVQNSRFDGRKLGTVGGDLLTNLLGAFRFVDNETPHTVLECAVLYLDVSGGKAVTPNGLALKTDRVTVVGGGEIDFPGDKIDFVLTPKAREGLGISASSLARAVYLGGSLKDPKIEIKPRGLITTGVNIASALASGGMTLVALGLYDRVHANSDVCDIARGRKKDDMEDERSTLSIGQENK